MATKKSSGKAEVSNVEQEENSLLDYLREHGIKSVKTVESSVWKWEDREPKYFKVLSVPVQNAKREGSKMEPATTIKVKDMESSNHYTLILNAVLLSGLTSNYPGAEIVGKCFVAQRLPAAEGKTYKNFEIHEVPDPE